MRKLSTFVLAALLLCACSKMESSRDNGIGGEDQDPSAGFVLNASSGEFVRTGMDSENYILWEDSDAISIWEKGNSSNANVPLTLKSESAGARKGIFSGSLTPAGADFTLYAVYPYSATYAADPESVTLSVPAAVNQCKTVSEALGTAGFLVGKADFSASDTEYAMLFASPLSLIDIVIDGSTSVLRGASIASLTISASSAFVGDVTVNLETGELTPVSSEDGKSLTITFPEGALMSTKQHAWISVLPVDLTAASCSFDLKMTNGQEIIFKVNPKKAFEPQTIYTMEFSDIDAKVDARKANPVYQDLVAMNGGERANCYVIREGGYYRFAAQRVDKTNCFSGSSPASNGYRADWLWATGTESKVDGVGLGNSGNINFRVAANANGNTIIALYDSSGNIAWSWHIWCTEEDPFTPTHYGRNESWLMTDRNLGAISKKQADVDSYGLMYQWGRKDPFPGPLTVGSNSSSKESTAFSTSTQAYVVNSKAPSDIAQFKSVRNTVAGAEDEVAYSIAHPMWNIHYNSNAGTTGCGNTWFYATPKETALLMWNSNGKKTGKTNYDPCPPGYMVPVTNAYAWSTIWPDNAGWETDQNLSGVYFAASETNTSYYPAVGYRNGGALTNCGYACYYWAANAVVDGSNLAAYGLGYSGRSTKSNGSKLQTQWALPVRCMVK